MVRRTGLSRSLPNDRATFRMKFSGEQVVSLLAVGTTTIAVSIPVNFLGYQWDSSAAWVPFLSLLPRSQERGFFDEYKVNSLTVRFIPNGQDGAFPATDQTSTIYMIKDSDDYALTLRPEP